MSLSSNIRNFFKTTAIYGVIGSVRSLTEFFLLPVYAGYLTTVEFGMLDILALLMMLGGIAAILELGNAVFRYYFDDPSAQFRKSVVSTAMLTLFLNGLAIMIIFISFSGQLSVSILGSARHSHLFILAGTFIFLNAVATIPINLFRIRNEAGKFTLVSLGQIAVSVIGICVFVIVMDRGVAGILWAKTLSAIPAIIIGLYLARDEIGLSFDFGLLKNMLKYSLPLIPAGVAIWGVNGLNRLFMLHYLTLEQIGLYSVGAKFVVIITLSVIAFQLAWPHFSLSNMNSSEAAATFASIFNIVAAIGLWMVIGITFFADTLIKFALSSGYAPAAAAVLPLSLGMFIYGLFYFFSTGPVFSKTTSMIIPPIAVAIAANVVLNIFLTPRFGFTGTAWVTTITYLIMTLGMIFTSRKCAYIAIEWGKIARLAAIAVPLVVFSAWTERMNGTYMLAIKIVLFLLFPLVLIFTGFIKWPAPDRTRLETAGNGKDFISEKRPCVELPVE